MVPKKIIVGLTGASGVEYGIRVIEALVESDVEAHVVASKWVSKIIKEETKYDMNFVKKIATEFYDNDEMDAKIASSSYLIDGMVVIPATVKTVGNIANGNTGNLITRAADIMLKMRKTLVIAIRETPLSPPCLHNLYSLSVYGAIVLPLSPGFYHQPENINDLFDFMTGKVLDCLEIPNNKYKRWNK